MANLDQLSRLGKAVMNAVVDAEMMGLEAVSSYLSMAFDEVVREAALLREIQVLEEAERKLEKSGEEKVAS